MVHTSNSLFCTIEPIQAEAPAAPRELDCRMSDGFRVRLLWNPEDGRITVAVDDTKTGDAFELPVRDRQRALDVFRHPYAYGG
jgi:hypothetical protein